MNTDHILNHPVHKTTNMHPTSSSNMNPVLQSQGRQFVPFPIQPNSFMISPQLLNYADATLIVEKYLESISRLALSFGIHHKTINLNPIDLIQDVQKHLGGQLSFDSLVHLLTLKLDKALPSEIRGEKRSELLSSSGRQLAEIRESILKKRGAERSRKEHRVK